MEKAFAGLTCGGLFLLPPKGRYGAENDMSMEQGEEHKVF